MNNIEVYRLHKAYGGQSVLAGLSLSIPAQGVTALCGPSGCGKTTLLRLIAGLEKPDSGTVSGLDGARISMLFQEDRLLPWYTARQNIAVCAPGADANRWLERVGLEGAGQKLPGELSGGMRRRVSIARALAFDGALFLLDEPFKALDDATRERMTGRIMQAVQGKPALLVTHELTQAAAMADTVLLLDGPPLRVVRSVPLPEPYAGRDPQTVQAYRLLLDQAWLP